MSSIIASQWRSRQNDRQSSPLGLMMGLMLDYDGTLAPIVTDPAQAFIQPAHIQLLKKLCDCPQVLMAIVSGRSVAQLKGFLGPLLDKPILLCGSHGGEIYSCSIQAFLRQPDASAYPVLIDTFSQTLSQMLTQQPLDSTGWLIEQKTVSVALHFRNLPEADKSLAQETFYMAISQLEPVLNLSRHMRVQPGKQVLELLPVGFDKGDCVRFLSCYWDHHTGQTWLCYAGDDLTDEHAFEQVNALNGLSLGVHPNPVATRAQHRLGSVKALYAELNDLLSQLTEPHLLNYLPKVHDH